MKSRHLTYIGSLCVAAGLVMALLFIAPASKRPATTNAAVPRTDTTRPAVSDAPTITGTPSHIEFPSVGVSVDVAPGYYDPRTDQWTLSNDKAHFATMTDQPNNKTGNTFIYGHNRWQVFTRLLDLKAGETATLTTSNGHRFTYRLRQVNDVEPNDTSYLKTHASPILTVQTCSGFRYQDRHMMIFDLVEAT